MNVSDLIIDPKSVGSKLLLTDIRPISVYEHGQRTDKISGYRYEVAMCDHAFDKLAVKIDGDQLIEKPDGYEEVIFDNLILSLYWTPNGYQVGAAADNIRLKSGKTTK